MKAETCFLIIIVVAMTAVIAFAAGFPYWQAKLAPLSVAGTVVILGLVELIREKGGSGATDHENQKSEDTSKRRESLRAYLIEGIWMTGFVIAIYLFGLLVAIPLFGIAYMKSHGATLPIAILTSVLTTLFCYGVFSYILDFELYTGIIF